MSDEPGNHIKAGYVPLKEYCDARFEAISRAVDKAESTLAARLAGMNEFRDTLKDQAATFISRDAVGLMLKPIHEDIRQLQLKIASAEGESRGKASTKALVFTALMSLVGLIIGLFSLFAKIR